MSEEERGKRNDVGTPPFSTLLREDSRVFQKGAKKYGADNWRKGLPYTETLDHVLTHIARYITDGPFNEEDSLLHLAQARWGLGVLMYMDQLPSKYAHFDDIHIKVTKDTTYEEIIARLRHFDKNLREDACQHVWYAVEKGEPRCQHCGVPKPMIPKV